MKKFLITFLGLLFMVSAEAKLSFQEIRTASKDVVVVFFKSDTILLDEVNVSNVLQWELNGQPVKAINRFVTESNKCDHYIYLTVPDLVNGKAYTLETPHGTFAFTFDERKVFCESIKVNQVAYSSLSKTRFANFAIWLGDGGVKKIEGKLPSYTVFEEFSGKQIASGELQEIGDDKSSGDYVYRIDLSKVPEGGPYLISVKGYGVSYPFGVGGDFSRRLGHVSFRSLYHQRCGVQIMWPYAWNIRMKPCHEVIYQTYGPIAEARLKVEGTEPTIKAWGGYHDAGDADRRTYHMDVTSTLLTTFEAFPQYFTDDQFNIPDKFDENHYIIGKGNGVPDIIDEAEWGAMFWEYFQEESGAIPWGTETLGYSPFTTYDKEDHLFGSEKIDPRTAAWASGMFMHLARIIQPYKPERTKQLVERAERAYKAAGENIAAGHNMYYHVEKYLLTGDKDAHQYIKDHASEAMQIVDTYNQGTEAFANRAWLVSYFYSYVIAKKGTDSATVKTFKDALKATAEKQLGYLASNAYPVGAPLELRWWGSNVAQGQYSFPVLMQWKLTSEQKYIDAVSQMMDYAMGLNPLGKCFMTGLGSNRVYNPHDRESAYTIEQGWGPRPGILIFGPGLATNSGVSYPKIVRNETPRERIYIDNLNAISQSEFTIYQSLCFPAAIYPILAKGGKYDESNNPYIQ